MLDLAAVILVCLLGFLEFVLGGVLLESDLVQSVGTAQHECHGGSVGGEGGFTLKRGMFGTSFGLLLHEVFCVIAI